MLETPVLKSICLAVSRYSAAIKQLTVLWRVNTGKAWAPTTGKPYRTAGGDIVVPGGRPVALGFSLVNGDPVVGTSDLAGRTSIVITPDMVGCTVAVFTVIEAKRSEGGRRSTDQKNFIATEQRAGSIAGFANSPEEAVNIIKNYHPPRL